MLERRAEPLAKRPLDEPNRAPAARAQRAVRRGRGAAGEAGRRIERIERRPGEARGERRREPRPRRRRRVTGGQRIRRVHGAKLARSGALREGRPRRIRAAVPQPSPPPRIFDRGLVHRRLDRAWALSPRRRESGFSPRPRGARARRAPVAGQAPLRHRRRFRLARPAWRRGARGGRTGRLRHPARPDRGQHGSGRFPQGRRRSRAPAGGGRTPRPRRLAAGAADRQRSAGRAGADAAARSEPTAC